MGRAARESVRERFLTSRVLADYLSLVRELASRAAPSQDLALGEPTPVAGDS